MADIRFIFTVHVDREMHYIEAKALAVRLEKEITTLLDDGQTEVAVGTQVEAVDVIYYGKKA